MTDTENSFGYLVMQGIDVAINTLPFIEIVKRVLFGLSLFSRDFYNAYYRK